MPFGTVRLLEAVLDLESFEHYVRNGIRVQWKDDLSLGYSFLVAMVLERLIDEVLLDPTIFGLQWNELVNSAHQRDVPFSKFPDKSNVGKVVRRLATEYREFLSTKTFAELKVKTSRAQADLLPQLVRWSGSSKFFQAPGATKLESEKVRDELATSFLINFVQDVPYVIVAYNNTFQRGRWAEPQFESLDTETHFLKIFDGFKLGVSYLWYAVAGPKSEDLFARRIRDAKD